MVNFIMDLLWNETFSSDSDAFDGLKRSVNLLALIRRSPNFLCDENRYPSILASVGACGREHRPCRFDPFIVLRLLARARSPGIARTCLHR